MLFPSSTLRINWQFNTNPQDGSRLMVNGERVKSMLNSDLWDGFS